jgi:hypothetical protein
MNHTDEVEQKILLPRTDVASRERSEQAVEVRLTRKGQPIIRNIGRVIYRGPGEKEDSKFPNSKDPHTGFD